MDTSQYFYVFLALVFVLALIGILALAARRLGFAPRAVGGAGRKRRLKVVEVMPLDSKRRLVLLKRDAVEHLVLLGAASELVVENAIPAAEEAALDKTPARRENPA